MSEQLTIQTRAAVALKSSKAEAELLALVDASKGITALTNKASRDECHGAAMTARNARTAITKASKSARDDAVQFSKAVIAEEARLVGIIKPEEDRLIVLRDEFDDEQARIKAKKAEEETARVASIKDRIEQIKQHAISAAHFSASAERAAELLAIVRETEVDATFEEFYGEAVEAKESAIAEISEVVHAKGAAEAAAKKAEADRVEAERLRRIAEAEAKAKADQEAKEREEADRIAAEQRKADDAKRKAEDAKRDSEHAAIKAEMDAKLKAIADAEVALEAKRKEHEAKEQAARDRAQAIKDAEAKAELDRRLAEERKAAEADRMADKALFDARAKIIDLAESITDTSVLAAMFDAASAVANKAVKLKAA